ncbi:hypothetical protein C1645_793038 [Glomus cerebriforme]|uniref:Uncharacterized protein n=1 Tax=Glomus cerebriforme TaxID=658196 RepID=A0A397S7A1_9GLOM|nr:hypothetical protein C1645_793038 [Glomus cerebriforme]
MNPQQNTNKCLRPSYRSLVTSYSICNAEDSTRIDTEYFDFLDYSSNDEYSEVPETNVNDDSTMLKNPTKTSRLYIPSHSSIVSRQRSTNAPNFSTTYSSTQDLSDPRSDCTTIKAIQRDLSNGSNSYQELDPSVPSDYSTNDPSVSCNLDPNISSFRPISQGSSKYGSNIIAAFLESDWPSDDEDETPFSSSIKERGQALYEEKRKQAEANRGTCDPGSTALVQARKAFPVNENNVIETSKNVNKRTVKNVGKGKRMSTKTNKRLRKQTTPTITTSTASLSNTIPGLQVISPRTIISGLSFTGFGQQQVEEQERPQSPVKGTKKRVRECGDINEHGDFDVDKMFEDFDPTAHTINVTPGTMYNQLLADISPSIRNRFAANSPGQEFDYLWATYGASVNKRVRKSPKYKERVTDIKPKIERDNMEVKPSSYQASLDAWAASDAASASQVPIVIEVPSTPPHQIRSASCTRTPGSAFSLSEFLNLSPSPM